MQVHVFINHDGESFQITEESVSMINAYSIIEQNHEETADDLNMILSKFSLKGIHHVIKYRMSEGDDYDIVNASTGEIVRRVHASF